MRKKEKDHIRNNFQELNVKGMYHLIEIQRNLTVLRRAQRQIIYIRIKDPRGNLRDLKSCRVVDRLDLGDSI